MKKKSNFVFGAQPLIKAPRSRFDLSHSVKTTMNVGTLYPMYLQEVYPGDTFKERTSIVARTTSAFLKPVMDNLWADIYYFFVPSRIVYDDFPCVFGENRGNAWAELDEVLVPTLGADNTTDGNTSGHVANALGLPSSFADNSVSVLPFRAFAKIYDDWFRDQNVIAPMNIQTGGQSQAEDLNDSPWSPNNYTGMLPKVAKVHDYFTSCLPSPQKGEPVAISVTTDVPVTTSQPNLSQKNDPQFPLYFNALGPNQILNNTPVGLQNNGENFFAGLTAGSMSSGNGWTSNGVGVYPSNLIAKTSDMSLVNVNDLRFAFQLQKMLERDARGGTRYKEYILSHFNVVSPDARLQRSEFLGGSRMPVSIQQVTQTSQSTENSPLAQVGAFSLSNGTCGFSKGFVEHGYIIGVMCFRYKHTYQQGVERFWTRRKRTDFYDPVFANIGEQPVYKTELYSGANKDEVFGYNEAWADLRYKPSKVSGQMASDEKLTQDVWHFADEYANAPVLSKDFIEENRANVKRCLSVSDNALDDFIVDIYHDNYGIREIPTYSIPSLIDHN